MRTTLACLLIAGPLLIAADPAVALSRRIAAVPALTADPNAPHWRQAPSVTAANSSMRQLVPGHAMEVRSLWTDRDLYLLFTAPYETLHLHPNQSTNTETNKLWDYDVVEAFLSGDLQRVRQYKEFQVSPQGEWVDLAIDRDNPQPEGGWKWNSGFAVKARRDDAKKVWYGEMRIPFASLDVTAPRAGQELRANFYRLQGPPPDRRGVAWQPTDARTYHVPEKFGRLRLVE